nr:hypothetical protein [Tanacetum cinerariifolium]
MSYFFEYEEIDGGYVAFGGDPKGGKITSKDTKCVLSPNFKLLDESQVLLRVPRKNNMYIVDLKNVTPSGGLTCLFAKATLDKSNLWHRRLGHINFKTMNKLVRRNLVRGIENLIDHKVKMIICNNRTEFKNKEMNLFYEKQDHLRKFDRKADDGFFVGYSVNSKAFRVFNSRTRIVEETLHITFLENKLNVARSRPTWLFDIDTLTKSMNYKPVEEKKDVKDLGNEDKKVLSIQESRVYQEKDANVNSTNNINIVSLTANAANIKDNVIDENIVYGCADDPNMPNLEEIVYSDDDEDVGVEADMTNLDTNIHGYTQEEGIDYDEVFALVARIKAIRLFLAYDSFKEFSVYQMDVKSAFLYGKIKEEVYVYQPSLFEDLEFLDRVYKRGQIDKTLFIKRVKGDILLVQVYVDDIIFGSTWKEMCTEFEKIMYKKFQMSFMGELTFFLGLQIDFMAMQEANVVANSTTKAEYVAASNYRRQGSGSRIGPKRQDTILRDRPAQTRFGRLSKQSYEPPLSRVNTLKSGEDSMQLIELMELCTKLFERVLALENNKTAQNLEIIHLKKRAKSLGDQEDASKQGRNDQDKGISFVQEDAETQRKYDHDIEINTTSTSITTASINITIVEPVTTVSAPITTAGVYVNTAELSTPPPPTTTVIEDEDLTIAHTIMKISSEKSKEKAKERGSKEKIYAPITTAGVYVNTAELSTPPPPTTTVIEDEDLTIAHTIMKISTSETTTRPIVPPQQKLDPKEKGKGKMVEPEKLLKKKDQIEFDKEVAQRLQAQFEEEERMARQQEEDTNIAEWDDVQDLKNKSFKEVQKAFDKTMSWINSFIPMDKEVVEGSRKKAKSSGKEAGSKKRTRKGLDEESVKRQKLEDDAKKEELRACLEIVQDDDSDIIISDESTKYYKIFSAMLDDFDKQDVKEISSYIRNAFKNVEWLLSAVEVTAASYEVTTIGYGFYCCKKHIVSGAIVFAFCLCLLCSGFFPSLDLGSFGEETDEITDLHQILEEVLLTEHEDSITLRRRRDLFDDDVWNLETALGRGQNKEDLESST